MKIQTIQKTMIIEEKTELKVDKNPEMDQNPKMDQYSEMDQNHFWTKIYILTQCDRSQT